MSHRFLAISFTDGPPAQLAYLKPNTTKFSGSKKKLDLYNFQHKDSDHIWIVCMYDEISVRLTQKLPQDVSKCEVDAGSDFAKVARCDYLVKMTNKGVKLFSLPGNLPF